MAVGYFSGSVDFGTGAANAGTTPDAFIATYDADGGDRRALNYGGSASNRAFGVAVGPGDSTAFCGLFTGMTNFGSGGRNSLGNEDGFVVRLGS